MYDSFYISMSVCPHYCDYSVEMSTTVLTWRSVDGLSKLGLASNVSQKNTLALTDGCRWMAMELTSGFLDRSRFVLAYSRCYEHIRRVAPALLVFFFLSSGLWMGIVFAVFDDCY